jgi:hypothetical protein
MRFHQDTLGEPSVTQTRAVVCVTQDSSMRAYAIPIHLFFVILLDSLVCAKRYQSIFMEASRSFLGGSYTSETSSIFVMCEGFQGTLDEGESRARRTAGLLSRLAFYRFFLCALCVSSEAGGEIQSIQSILSTLVFSLFLHFVSCILQLESCISCVMSSTLCALLHALCSMPLVLHPAT